MPALPPAMPLLRRLARLAAALPCALALTAPGAARAQALQAPPAVEDLRHALFDAEWQPVRALRDEPAYTARLVGYRSAGLSVRAMVATPRQPAPPSGYPVLVACRGFHPQPSRYGIGADGVDARPGDYYRRIPALYAARGFVVLVPDYRGHSDSEGAAYTGRRDSSAFYAHDVLAALPGLRRLPGVDLGRVYLWGHSLGAEVALRVLLASELFAAATLWSSVDSSGLAPQLDPLQHLGQLGVAVLVHHARGDATTPHSNSERLAAALARHGRLQQFHSYAGEQHLFEGEALELAVDRDTSFLLSRPSRPAAPAARS